MKKTLLVFDIDGTLTDSVSQHQAAFYSSLEDIGIKNIDSNWGDYIHHTDRYIFERNYENYFEKESQNSDLIRFEELILKHLSTQPAINEIEGASDFLQKSAEKGYAYCLVTGSLKNPAINKMEQAKISFNEKLLATASENVSRDEIVLNAIEKAKKFYQQDSFPNIISLGDGIWDLRTAKNLNFSFIAIGKTSEKLVGEGAESHFIDYTSFNLD